MNIENQLFDFQLVVIRIKNGQNAFWKAKSVIPLLKEFPIKITINAKTTN